jgi:hypothetical protein
MVGTLSGGGSGDFSRGVWISNGVSTVNFCFQIKEGFTFKIPYFYDILVVVG